MNTNDDHNIITRCFAVRVPTLFTKQRCARMKHNVTHSAHKELSSPDSMTRIKNLFLLMPIVTQEDQMQIPSHAKGLEVGLIFNKPVLIKTLSIISTLLPRITN